jgi:DNA-binding response OmpR family regulator
MQKILIVEDDISLGFLLMEFLESEGFEVKLARDGAAGWAYFQKGKFDLCIFDVMMPKMDGFTLARKIRKLNPKIPFLFLTAKSLKTDKLEGFSIGAEDFITKPFDEEVLLCRIQVILRREQTDEDTTKECLPTKFQIGNYFFDAAMQELTFENTTKRITEKENEVLHLLCLHQNKILRRDEAVEKIYGRKDYFLGRSFDVFISKLRKLLQHDSRIQIENVFRVGFILKVKNEALRNAK